MKANAVNEAASIQKAILLPYQSRLVYSDRRFTLSNWSRQIGKSFGSSLRRLLRGMKRRRNQFFLSAGERQSAELILKVKQHVEAIERIQLLIEDRDVYCPSESATFKELSIKLPDAMGGIRIVGLPANPDTARGFTGDALLDEYAIHKKDREIWAALFPTVTRGEGELDVASTPKGKLNMFFRLVGNPAFEYTKVTIYDAVADGLELNPEELRIAINDDEIWRQEFLCEFIDGATAFLTLEQIAACSDESLPRELDIDALAKCDKPVFTGIDIGRKRDLTVIWSFEMDGGRLVSRGMLELRGLPFREQFELASKVVRHSAKTCVDATGLGMQMAEDLVADFGEDSVEACTFTNQFKADVAGGMRTRFEDQTILIPHAADIRDDLHSVEKDVTAAGTMRLWAKRENDTHADRFWGAALACRAAEDDGVGPMEVELGPRLASTGLANW